MCLQVIVTGGIDESFLQLPFILDCDEDSYPAIDSGKEDVYRSEFDDEITYDVSFPCTANNTRLFGNALSPSFINSNRVRLEIIVMAAGEPLKPDIMITTRNGLYTDGRYSVVLTKAKTWVKLAKAKKITDIPLGLYLHSRGNIISANNLGTAYADFGTFYRYPYDAIDMDLGDFDRRDSRYYVVASEQRPYIYALPFLRMGFRSIGYTFKCPFLESALGRRILMYILSDNYNNIITPRGLKLDWTGLFLNFYPLPGVNQYKDIFGVNPFISDNEYFVSGRYREPVWSDILLEYKASLSSGDNVEYFLRVYIGEKHDVGHDAYNGGLGSNLIYEHNGFVKSGEEQLEAIPLNDIVTNERDQLRFDLVTKDPGGTLKISDVKITTTKIHKTFLKEGSVFNLNSILQPDDTLIDVFYGIAHILFGKIVEDYNNKVLTLYTPYDVDYMDVHCDGFYKNVTTSILNGRIVSDTFYVEDPLVENDRFINLKYKDTNDVITASYLNKEENRKNSVNGAFIDFGDTYPSEIDVIDNKYFEPTVTERLYQEPYITFPVVGTRGGRMIDVGRRILFAIGKEESFGLKGGILGGVIPVVKRFYSHESSPEQVFLAMQTFDSDSMAIGPEVLFMHLSYSLPKNKVYAHKTIYEIIVKKYLKTIMTSSITKAQFNLPNNIFGKLSRREQYYFSYGIYVVCANLFEFDEYKPCGTEPIELRFKKSDVFSSDPVILEYVENRSRPTDPENFDIEVTVDGCTYLVDVEDNPIE